LTTTPRQHGTDGPGLVTWIRLPRTRTCSIAFPYARCIPAPMKIAPSPPDWKLSIWLRAITTFEMRLAVEVPPTSI
jgi:hypothetical protein